jgi:hypothetical protein
MYRIDQQPATMINIVVHAVGIVQLVDSSASTWWSALGRPLAAAGEERIERRRYAARASVDGPGPGTWDDN